MPTAPNPPDESVPIYVFLDGVKAHNVMESLHRAEIAAWLYDENEAMTSTSPQQILYVTATAQERATTILRSLGLEPMGEVDTELDRRLVARQRNLLQGLRRAIAITALPLTALGAWVVTIDESLRLSFAIFGLTLFAAYIFAVVYTEKITKRN